MSRRRSFRTWIAGRRRAIVATCSSDIAATSLRTPFMAVSRSDMPPAAATDS